MMAGNDTPLQAGEAVSYRARWILPDSHHVLAGGVVTVSGGRIVSVRADAARREVDLGEVIVIPGPINAHVHLDLSGVPARIPAEVGMAAWLEKVVGHRRSAGESATQARQLGWEQSIAAGTAAAGDIQSITGPESLSSLEPSLIGVAYREVIGLKPERYESLWAKTDVEAGGSVCLRAGISPHAPYSTASEVYRRCWRLSPGTPLSTHWLESEEERAFLGTGRGPLRDFLERIGAWPDSWHVPTDPWEEYLGSGRWNLIHCNHLTDREIAMLARPEWRERVAAVTYCPRTHAWFGHPPHPWPSLLSAGVPVALGTDSLASSPDLSVVAEAQWLASHHPTVPPSTLLDMLTIHGATALGLSADLGTLEEGKSATFAVFDPAKSTGRDPFERVFDPSTELIGLMVEGEWRWRRGGE